MQDTKQYGFTDGAGASFCPYADARITQLGDVINARAKLRHGALAHIITARIIDSHPSSEQLQNLIDNPQYLDQLFAHIAAEVLPGSVPIKTGAVPQATIESPGHALERLPSLSRTNSWSQLLLYQRA